jgi:uncharacterized membrane protein YgcG
MAREFMKEEMQMKPEMEKQVLTTLYNRLFDAITHRPEPNQPSAFDKATTFIQFSKNEVLNPADFANAVTPVNPNGDLNTAEMFSRMVDIVPLIQADYAPSGTSLSKAYPVIVNGANSDVQTDPGQQDIYDQAYKYLNIATIIKDYTGKTTTTYAPSPIYNNYLLNQGFYIAAVGRYRNTYLNYDLTKPSDQKKWQAVEPSLRNDINQAYNNWRGQGASEVEGALNAINTSINSSVRNALAAAQQAVAAQNQMAPSLPTLGPWYMTYALPTNWYDESAVKNFSDLTLTSAHLDEHADSNYTRYGGGASWSGGLFSIGGNVSGGAGSSNYHMDASNFTLTAKLGTVRIFRPWLYEFIFRMPGWFIDAYKKGRISNGKLQGNENAFIPLIPVAFIVARDITITADFSTQDRSHIESSISASTRIGWGPFSVGGHYSHSESHDYFHSTFDGGTLKIPGIQIVAWISEIVPFSPPLDPK